LYYIGSVLGRTLMVLYVRNLFQIPLYSNLKVICSTSFGHNLTYGSFNVQWKIYVLKK